jgi:hypothetical protein
MNERFNRNQSLFLFFIGERELAKSKTNRNKFEQKQVCFVIDN